MDGWSHQADQNYKLRVSPRTKQCPHPKAPIHHIIKFQVRENPWYKQNIASLSRLMKDRRTRPMDDAVWLVEYLARTRGAEHLKVNSRHLGGVADQPSSLIEKCPLLQDFSRIILWTFFSSLDQLWWSSSSASTTSFLIYSEPAVPQESKKSYDTSKDNQ